MDSDSFVMVLYCDKIKPSDVLLCMRDQFCLYRRVFRCEFYDVSVNFRCVGFVCMSSVGFSIHILIDEISVGCMYDHVDWPTNVA